MALRDKKEVVLRLRSKGMSYGQIKEKTGISKSTLSNWLHDYPLSPARIKKLRDNNPVRIEKFRNTMQAKRNARLAEVFKCVKNNVGSLSKRELFLAGLFLYWGEGGKTQRYTLTVSNTNPQMLQFFIKWFYALGVDKKEFSVRLHLYKDMNIQKETSFWKKTLNIPKECFKKPYIKDSNLTSITYKTGFSHGTCNISVHGRDLAEYVHMGLKCIEAF